MKVLDPGHRYELASLDGDLCQTIQFVKREGEHFPGNIGTSPGTTLQDVIRCLIDRVRYVNAQIPHAYNTVVITSLKQAMYMLELRAAEAHHRELRGYDLEDEPVCAICGHVQCTGTHRASQGGDKCGEFVAHLIAGASWFPCLLKPGHDGGHRAGGKCLVHGPYLSEEGAVPQCPKWPECAKGGDGMASKEGQ